MRRLLGRTGWASFATFFSAALMAAGLSFTGAPAQAAFELPEGEKITNLPAIPRAIPQKEALRTLRSEDRQKLRSQELLDACGPPRAAGNAEQRLLRRAMAGRTGTRPAAGVSIQVVVTVPGTLPTIRQLERNGTARPMISLSSSGCASVSAMTSRRT